MSLQTDFTSSFINELIKKGWDADTANLFGEFAASQAANESANFTSDACINYNNCIGYGYYAASNWQDGIEHQTSDDVKNLAGYSSIQNCACELADWINRRKLLFQNCNNLYNYCCIMKSCGYFTENIDDYYNNCCQYFTDTQNEGSINPVYSFISNFLGIIFQSTISTIFFIFIIVVLFFKSFKK